MNGGALTTVDRIVLGSLSLLALGSWLLLRWARVGDDALADFGGDDQ